MSRAHQLTFQMKDLNLKTFGGAHLKGNAKFARPISVKRPIHLVMRSTMATKRLSFLNPIRAKRIQKLIHSHASRLGLRVYRYANAGNHLHLVIKTPSRQAFRTYIRSISGLIARLTTGIEKGSALGRKFWDARPFSRIIEWGREYLGVCSYLLQNTLEALGFISYQTRNQT